MVTLISKLDQPQNYVYFYADEKSLISCPGILIVPGKNELSDDEISVLKRVPAFIDHANGGYIEISEAGDVTEQSQVDNDHDEEGGEQSEEDGSEQEVAEVEQEAKKGGKK